MKQFNKREKILGITIIGLLFAFLFKAVVFDPLREKLNSAQKGIQHARVLLRKYHDLSGQKDAINSEYKQIEGYLSLKGSDEERLASILSKIEVEARTAGLVVQDMKTEASPKTKSLPRLYRVSLRAEGDVTKIVDFIYRLENADILLRIDKIGLSLKEETGANLKMDAVILAIALS